MPLGLPFLGRKQGNSSVQQRERFVRVAYQGLFHREPEDEAFKYWVDALARLSYAEILESFLNCEEFDQVSKEKLFVPPGHYYSPIVNIAEAEAHLRQVEAKETPKELPGINIDREEMVRTWDKLLPFMRSAPFGENPDSGLRYGFVNPAYSWGDASVLHAMLRLNRPKRVIEIGSGWSSACTIDTVESYLSGDCELTFIEPYPQLLKELLGGTPTRTMIHILECGVQQVSLDTFESLRVGDVLFIDSTHVLRTGSDVCYELFEILPRLAPGVLVHFHDMFWPFEYPRSWVVEENRSWNELYAVRAFLTDNAHWRVAMFNDYMAKLERDLIESTYPKFNRNSGGALWIQKQ